MTQTVIALAIVALAVAWLAKRIYLTLAAAVSGKIDKIGNCGNCSRNPATRQPAVIELGLSKSKPRKDDSA
jgi:hypothetical protein